MRFLGSIFVFLIAAAFCLGVIAVFALVAMYLANVPIAADLIHNGLNATQKPLLLQAAAPYLAVGGSVTAALVALFGSLRQVSAARDLERLKTALAKNAEAYDTLFAAARKYHRALASLGSGQFDAKLASDAEIEVQRVEGKTVFVSDEFQDAWMMCWQIGRDAKEQASKISAPDQATLKKLWEKTTAGMAQEFKIMRAIVQKLQR